ncbi:hypothetical protein GpSGHVEth158 [Glossina pallidipes salivary gland hypertrophy virus]|uniref:Uncharacterized protein n=1 Tax=Glossina hytrovirus (isolate Glossina pallidipes/Ethiopia/Seibersdorf/-) TaxID=379529 RepID=A0A109QSZ2_GHVS|nr:hypothetical protein GpSGHVEth158 [Glossina pallidipes salivary gland hypertrophy virus]
MNKKLFLQCKECDDFLKSDIFLHREYIKRNGIVSKYFGNPITTNWKLVKETFLGDYDYILFDNFTRLAFIDEVGFDSRWPYAFNTSSGDWYLMSVNQQIWDYVYKFIAYNRHLCVMPNWCLSYGNNPGNVYLYQRQLIVMVDTLYCVTFHDMLNLITKLSRRRVKNIKPRRKLISCYKISSMASFLNIVKSVSQTQSIFKTNDNYYVNSPVIPHFKLICLGLFSNSHNVISKILNMKVDLNKIYKFINFKDFTIQMKHLIPIKDHVMPFRNILLEDIPNRNSIYTSDVSIIGEKKYINMIVSPTKCFYTTTREEYNKMQYPLLINLFENAVVELNEYYKCILNIYLPQDDSSESDLI